MTYQICTRIKFPKLLQKKINKYKCEISNTMVLNTENIKNNKTICRTKINEFLIILGITKKTLKLDTFDLSYYISLYLVEVRY